jgi:hypothetical protein
VWGAEVQAITAGHRYRLAENGTPLSSLRTLELLASDERFAHWFTSIIATSPYQAVYWELPPLCASTLDSTAEFVLIDAPGLARMAADPRPFSQHFDRQADDDVIVFPNLGGDALLVVPVPREPMSACTHLAEFVRHAPGAQVRALWRTLSETAIRRISAEPVWLSTAGDAVAWLHLRLDTRPKYYHHRPYMAPP